MTRRDTLTLPLLALILTAFAGTRAGADDKKADPPKKRVVGIVVYPGVEALDFCGPYEVFSVAHTHDSRPTPNRERWRAE